MSTLPERVLWIFPHNGHTMGVELANWVIPLWREAGVQVEAVAVTPAPAGLAPVARVAGEPLPPPLVGRGLTQGLAATGAVRRLLGRYPAVVVDQDLEGEIRVAMAAAGLARRPALFLAARWPLEYLTAQGEHRIGRRRRYLEAYYRAYDRIWVFSDKARQDLMVEFRLPKERVRRLSPPIPVERLAEGSAEPWPWPDAAAPVVASWGEWTAERGGAVLVEAARRVAASGQRLRLLLLGGGPEGERLAAQAEQAGVEAALVGWPEQVGAWLARSRVYVAPAYFDGMGLDLLAAMAVGVPVVATNAPTAAIEVLARGTVGRLVSIGEPESLAATLAAYLSDERLRQGFALGGRQRARLFFAERLRQDWLAALSLAS